MRFIHISCLLSTWMNPLVGDTMTDVLETVVISSGSLLGPLHYVHY